MVIVSSPSFNLDQIKQGKTCKGLLTEQAREELYFVPSTDDPSSVTRIRFANQQSPNTPDSYPDTLLSRWKLERGFDDVDIERLKLTDSERDPKRTTYLGFAYTTERYDPLNLDIEGESFSGLRFFDGSTVPLFQNRPNHLISKETRHLTFEPDLETMGFRLPERVIEELTGRPSYIFEIGLLNVERDIHNGLSTLLKNTTRFIDAHYNYGLFSVRRSLTEIERIGPVFYVSCKKAHVRIYEEYGFKLVESLELNGPVRTSSGLFIMKAFASEMIKSNESVSPLPLKKSEKDEGMRREQSSADGTIMWIESLEKRAPVIITKDDFQREITAINDMRKDFFHSGNSWRDLLHYPDVKLKADLSRPGLQPASYENSMNISLYAVLFEKMYQLAYAALLRLPPEDEHLFEDLLAQYRFLLLSLNYRENYEGYKDFAENNPNALIPFF